ncbi:hypothetical protein FQA39_LY06713 [Lamprigera yunnana]|nr:hypothetical protein FQA39_LY06713 [Lamprigera yunnana]
MAESIPRTMTAAERNREDFLKTITLYRDYQTCTFNRYEMENIFCLKPIIEYRLEVIQSPKLKELYDNLVECVIVQKCKRGEIRKMAAAAAFVGDVDGENIDVVPDENVRESMDVYEIFEQTLNYKCNINSHNVLYKQKHGDRSRKYIHTIKPLLLWEQRRGRGQQQQQQQDQIERATGNLVTGGGRLYKQFIPGGGGIGHEGAPIEYRYWNIMI